MDACAALERTAFKIKSGEYEDLLLTIVWEDGKTTYTLEIYHE